MVVVDVVMIRSKCFPMMDRDIVFHIKLESRTLGSMKFPTAALLALRSVAYCGPRKAPLKEGNKATRQQSNKATKQQGNKATRQHGNATM